MSASLQNRGPSGVDAAMARYGVPLMERLEIPVSQETLDYWRQLKDGRVAEVVLLVRRQDGRYLLHTKAFYPEGAYRLMTGGINAGEDLIQAALREAREETGLVIEVERLLGVLAHRFVHGDQGFDFTSYLIELTEVDGTLGVQDEHEQISGYIEVAPEELSAVADRLEALDGRWHDWGVIRAAAHRLAARALEGTSG